LVIIKKMFDQYTIIFKKNGDEVTEAEGGDIIDVQLKITAANPTRYEIFNFNRSFSSRCI